MIVDAKNQIAGRLASNVAKTLMSGEKVIIVNAEKAVISGKTDVIIGEYLQKTARGDPYHGPFYPKQPELMLKRIIRGMLPYKTEKGMAALKNLRVYIGVPEEFKNEKFASFEGASGDKIKETRLVSLGEISSALGVKKRW